MVRVMSLTNSFLVERKITKAERKREELVRRGHLSTPEREGDLTIFVAKTPVHTDTALYLGAKANGLSPQQIAKMAEQREAKFNEEALRIEGERGRQYASVHIMPASRLFLDLALKDREISGIVVIGNGSVNGIDIEDADSIRRYTWEDVSKQADHLKTGAIEQRLPRVLDREFGNVPFGTFAVESLARVYIPAHDCFPDCIADDGSYVQPFSERENLREQIHDMNYVASRSGALALAS